jgi:pimeloyl-ACP methyl ester carboxylesterase
MHSLALVLLPGLDGTGIMFEPFVKHLPAEWEPIVVRYPDDRFLNYDALVPLVRAVLPPDKPFLLLGESFGGPLSIKVAAEQPPGLVGLVLCATFATSAAPWLPRFCHGMVRPSTVFAWQVSGRFWARLRGICPPEVRRLFNRIRHHARFDVIANRVRVTVRVDVTSDLKRVGVPILYLSARRDHVVPQKCLQTLLQHRPDVQVQAIDTSHWVLQTNGPEVVAALQTFVETCQQPRHAVA